MVDAGFTGVEFWIVNTDAQARLAPHAAWSPAKGRWFRRA
jgi:cell division GTPase FtsZ